MIKPESLLKVQTPNWVRQGAYWLIILYFIFILLLGFIPWQQTVMGAGRITSFSPNNRPQQIEAPIKGRIKKWHVLEGQNVKKGDLIVDLQDLEKDFLPPEIIQLSQDSKTALQQNQQAYMQKASSIDDSVRNLRQNLNDSLNAARKSVEIAKGELKTAQLNLSRTQTLANKGLASEREKELALQNEIKARGDLERAKIELERINSKTLSEITKLQSEKASAIADSAKSADEIAKINTKISTAEVRQDISHVRSPIDGIVVRLFKRGPGETFKESEQIAVITPESMDQAVEMFINDLDAPLVYKGARVRLQFSGWPALQFAGLSKSLKLGTFGGIVALVDNVDSGNGKYRVLVIPDKNEEAWPITKYLRPGTRAAGWIILKTVPLGYELWRRFNGFRIALSDVHGDFNVPTYGGDDKDKDKETEKEEKSLGVIFKKKK